MEDETIVLKCQKGELEEFGKLYEKYVKKIYDFIYFKTLHKENAEDLTSQIFFKALEKINSFNPEKAKFSTWLYTIANNLLIDHWRGNKETVDIEDVWGLSTNEDIERQVDAKINIENIKKYMDKLSPLQREIIILRVWNDLPYKEIAAILNKSETSVKTAFSRAINDVREAKLLSILMLISLNI